jgi:hypothetical protein
VHGGSGSRCHLPSAGLIGLERRGGNHLPKVMPLEGHIRTKRLSRGSLKPSFRRPRPLQFARQLVNMPPMERIAHVYEPDGTLFGSYVLVIPMDQPTVLQRAALSFAIDDGLPLDRARRCKGRH